MACLRGSLRAVALPIDIDAVVRARLAQGALQACLPWQMPRPSALLEGCR